MKSQRFELEELDETIQVATDFQYHLNYSKYDTETEEDN